MNNIKTQNDYPKSSVKYLTEEVLDAIELVISTNTKDYELNFKKTREFIRRNNLNCMSIAEFKKYSIKPYGLEELVALAVVQRIFIDCTYPELIKTPKQTVLTFWNYNLEFEDDYCTKIEMCTNNIDFSEVQYNVLTFSYYLDKLRSTTQEYYTILRYNAHAFTEDEIKSLIITSRKVVQDNAYSNVIDIDIDSSCSSVYYNYNDKGELESKSNVMKDLIKSYPKHKIYNTSSNYNDDFSCKIFQSVGRSKLWTYYNKSGDHCGSRTFWEYKDGCKFLFNNVYPDTGTNTGYEKVLIDSIRFDDKGNIKETFNIYAGCTDYNYTYNKDNVLIMIESERTSRVKNISPSIIHFAIEN